MSPTPHHGSVQGAQTSQPADTRPGSIARGDPARSAMHPATNRFMTNCRRNSSLLSKNRKPALLLPASLPSRGNRESKGDFNSSSTIPYLWTYFHHPPMDFCGLYPHQEVPECTGKSECSRQRPKPARFLSSSEREHPTASELLCLFTAFRLECKMMSHCRQAPLSPHRQLADGGQSRTRISAKKHRSPSTSHSILA